MAIAYTEQQLTDLAKKYGMSVIQLKAYLGVSTGETISTAGKTTTTAPKTASAPVSQNIYTQAATTGQTSPIDSIQKQIQQVQDQLKTRQLQVAALQKYGLKDTNELTQDADGNWVPINQTDQTETPMPDEFQKYLDEAQTYYEPAKQTEMSELEKQVKTEKQRLSQDWQQYQNDINTGKIRAGSDYQTQLQRQLEQKSEYLQQQEFNIKQNMNTLNRNWIQKGGLFSGVRLQAGQNYMTQENMAQQQYLSGVNYNLGQLGTQNARTTEDYATSLSKGQTAYSRGEEDITLQRIKDIRSLTEKYNTAIGEYAGQSATYDWRKNIYGY